MQNPTIHCSQNERGESHIGGKWMRCTPQPRRKAIRAVIDAEESTPKPSTIRTVHASGTERVFEPVPRDFSQSRFESYTRMRSGVQDAYARRFRELNPHLYAG